MLKTKDLVKVTFDAVDPWSEILAYIAYAVQCSYHSMLQATTGQLVFGQYMLLDIKSKLNYKEMQLRKQKIINNNNKRENEKRVQYEYVVGHYA